MPTKKIDFDDDEGKALLTIVQDSEKYDQFIRERNIRIWRRAEEYWRLNQFIYWSDIAHDYRALADTQRASENEEAEPKVFGIYRAYGESLIAAMAAAIPAVLFFPDDADEPDDITTAKAYSQISELVQKHNQAPLLFIRALATLYNQGLVASYTYFEEDEKYGTIKQPNLTQEKIQFQQVLCPECGTTLGNKPIIDKSAEDEFKDERAEGYTPPADIGEEYKCNCGYQGEAELGEVFDEIIPRLSGFTILPKGRVMIEMYGPLHVRVDSYARKQADIGMLELQLETDLSAARSEFCRDEDGKLIPKLAKEINSISALYTYERWGRSLSEHLSDIQRNQVTVRYCWLRPWKFEILGETQEDMIQKLRKKFPHGCCVVFVNNTPVRAYDESMDDHWTISHNPLDSWLHGMPIGKSIVDIQDVYNEIKNLQIQKEEFGISETFVTTDAIDEENYRQQESGPGYLTFCNPTPGRAMGDSFFQTRAASVGQDDIELAQSINADAQFLSGSVPSIFGGAQVTGSKTASEYNQSRNFALQRLSNHWTNIKYFWAETMGKSARLFATKMLEDEKYVKRNANSFETVWIRKAELTGKIGNVEPDINEQFPITWAQKRDLLIQLITLQNPAIGAILLHPNNSQIVKDALGYPEIYIPGEADRTKQLIEIRKLVQVDSSQLPPNAQQPTIMPDQEADDDQTHVEVCRLWLVSEEGMYIKETNPAAYLNVVLHLKIHNMQLQAKTQMPSGSTAAGQPPIPKAV